MPRKDICGLMETKIEVMPMPSTFQLLIWSPNNNKKKLVRLISTLRSWKKVKISHHKETA